MIDAENDPRLDAIQKSAWQAFSTYGFRKTSMDDIAQGAGISRPALYLRYKNKEDVFRSLARHYYDEKEDELRQILSRKGTVVDLLTAAFAAQCAGIVEAMLTSPHGRELLDVGTVAASDVVTAGEAAIAGVYADWLAAGADTGQIRLTGPAQDVAQTLTTALYGAKKTATDFDAYKAQVAQLAALFGAGLTAP